jgi:hypothetical protein
MIKDDRNIYLTESQIKFIRWLLKQPDASLGRYSTSVIKNTMNTFLRRQWYRQSDKLALNQLVATYGHLYKLDLRNEK